MSVVIRLKVPTEMHYTVIPMGTSIKVNSTAEMASDQTELRDIQELTTTIRKTQLYNYLFYYQPFYHVQHKDIYIEPKLLNKK